MFIRSRLSVSVVIAMGLVPGVALGQQAVVMPVEAEDASKAVYGPCADWPGLTNGCRWFSMQSREAKTVWRDVNPYQKEKGEYGFHLGSDLNLGSGSFDAGRPVRAISSGTIVRVVENARGWGNVLFVRHTTPLGAAVAMYGHVNWLDNGPPIVGAAVTLGDIIAKVGNGEWTPCAGASGSCKYPYHLHFEIRRNGNYDLGTGYTKERITYGPQGQIDPIGFLKSAIEKSALLRTQRPGSSTKLAGDGRQSPVSDSTANVISAPAGYEFLMKSCDQELSKLREVYVFARGATALRNLRDPVFARSLTDKAGAFAVQRCPTGKGMRVNGNWYKSLGEEKGNSNVIVEIFGNIPPGSVTWRTPRIVRARNNDRNAFNWREYEHRPGII